MKKLLPTGLSLFLIAFLSWVVAYPIFSDTDGGSGVSLAAAGDVIMHLPVVQSVYNPRKGQYDFRPCLSEVKDYLSEADVAVAVLETTLAAEDDRNFSGYPTFKAPSAIADALKWAGIDLVFTAHNHIMDQGDKGIRNTLSYLNKIDLPQSGCRAKAEDTGYQIIEKNGLKLAFLSYTTSTNGILVPPGEKYLVNLLDFDQLDQTVKRLRESKVDGIILALHTGIEYQRQPSKEQQEIVKRLLQSGVDVILGSHVHVIQPFEMKQVTLKEGESKECFIAYSLGNFLSNQQWRYSDCGLMVTLKLSKSPQSPGLNVRLLNHQPIWVHRYSARGKYVYRIKKVEGPECQDSDPSLDAKAKQRLAEVWNETEALLDDWNKNVN